MSVWIVIRGVKPWDGRYRFDGDFTYREAGWVASLAGYFPGSDDPPGPLVQVVAAVVAMRRAGRVDTRDVEAVFDRLVDAPLDAITEETDEVELEERPPDPTPASSSGSSGSNGAGSSTSSASPDSDPSPRGIPASDISEFDPSTSAT